MLEAYIDGKEIKFSDISIHHNEFTIELDDAVITDVGMEGAMEARITIELEGSTLTVNEVD